MTFSKRFYKAMQAKEKWREEQRALPFEEKLRLLDAYLRETQTESGGDAGSRAGTEKGRRWR